MWRPAIGRTPHQFSRRFEVAQMLPYKNTFPMPFDAYVSILCMPIGVLICFGPALLLWLKEETGGEDPKKK
jgi:hypothetical protein